MYKLFVSTRLIWRGGFGFCFLLMISIHHIFKIGAFSFPAAVHLEIGKELLDARVLKCDHYLIEYEYEYTYILWLIL